MENPMPPDDVVPLIKRVRNYIDQLISEYNDPAKRAFLDTLGVALIVDAQGGCSYLTESERQAMVDFTCEQIKFGCLQGYKFLGGKVNDQ